MSDAEKRPDVVLYRKQFVADFIKLVPRMFVYRRVNVHMAKQYLPAATKNLQLLGVMKLHLWLRFISKK
jgi:hypothetical protein